MHYLKEAIITVLVLAVGTVAVAQQPPKDLIKTKLVADVTSVVPGNTFTLGVLFEMKPEWHVYWHNPGESGLATTVTFTLPDGVKAGPILYPAPDRFIQPGDILGYGYHGSVLLGAKVTAAKSFSDKTVPITAKVRWLSCKDVCIPGSADLEWSLPLSAATAPANAAVFTDWEESLPVEAFSAGVQLSVSGTLPGDGSAGEFAVRLDFSNSPAKLEWFPYTVRGLRITEEAVKVEGTSAEIRFKAALMKGHELSSRELGSVVTYDSGGEHMALRVAIPLQSAQ
jgi:DsbC/DsbD-like thiol-disulfide interchange protein